MTDTEIKKMFLSKRLNEIITIIVKEEFIRIQKGESKLKPTERRTIENIVFASFRIMEKEKKQNWFKKLFHKK